MLKSLCNHRQSQQPTRRNGRIAGGMGLVADKEKKSQSFVVIKSIAIEFVPANRWDWK